MNKKLIIGALVVCLLAFVAVMAFSQSSANVRWEYMAIDISGVPDNVTQRANALGREGWELVSAHETGNHYGLIFKRRLP